MSGGGLARLASIWRWSVVCCSLPMPFSGGFSGIWDVFILLAFSGTGYTIGSKITTWRVATQPAYRIFTNKKEYNSSWDIHLVKRIFNGTASLLLLFFLERLLTKMYFPPVGQYPS